MSGVDVNEHYLVFDFTKTTYQNPIPAGFLKNYEGDQFNVVFVGFQAFIKPTSTNGEILYAIDPDLA